jgi:hypothetical protein
MQVSKAAQAETVNSVPIQFISKKALQSALTLVFAVP